MPMDRGDPHDADESEGSQMEEHNRPPVPKRRVFSLSRLRANTESPDRSCESMQSDRSVGRLIDFRENAERPDPTSVSMKSDRSVGRLIDFREDGTTADPSESMKSDRSVGRLIDFRGNAERPDPTSVSMKSDRSVGRLIDFRKESSGPSCASMKSDRSIGRIIDLRERPASSEDPSCEHDTLDSTFQILEEHLLAFVKDQLKRFRRVLASDYPERSESEEGEDHSSREALLKITLDFLRRMKQEHLAKRLHNRSHVGVCRENVKRRLQQRFSSVFEDTSTARLPSSLQQIYTELYITEGGAAEVTQEHEVRHIEASLRKPATAEAIITSEELFRSCSGEGIRTVLTKSEVSVEKGQPIRTVLTKSEVSVEKGQPIRTVQTKSEVSVEQGQPIRTVLTKSEVSVEKGQPIRTGLTKSEVSVEKGQPIRTGLTKSEVSVEKGQPIRTGLTKSEVSVEKGQPIRTGLTKSEVSVEKGQPIRTVLTKSEVSVEKGQPIRTGLTKSEVSVEKGQPIRTVLTKGVAGVGKTVLTQKLSLDWAEGRAHQDVQLLFPFTFRELNVLRDSEFSLEGLIHHHFSQTKGLHSFEDLQLLFILDGLDECRLPLDFSRTRVLTEPTESASVEELLVNLIRGSLLPSARLWITTRPAAANQIPAECVSMVTEVRGFSDPQKEQYFRKMFLEKKQADTIISHIKASPSLHAMCHLPIFCWILSTVLKHLLSTKELPQTLTQMYVHFLVAQAKVKNVKYHEGTGADLHWTPETREMVWSLGKLAFEQLQKGNLIFYESDLKECGLDAAEVARYSGVFTQVFREERGLYQDKVYCFIHLSVQEFLAALHVHQTFFSSGENLLSPQLTSNVKATHLEQSTKPKVKPKAKRHVFMRKHSDLQTERISPVTVEKSTSGTDFYRSAVDRALQSPSGHLDLLLRFLLGLSLPTNQSLLRGLLTPTGSDQTNQETVWCIKERLNEDRSTERSLNLFHCLNELNDRSLVETIQRSLRGGTLTDYEVSPSDWSAVAFILLTSDSDLEEFDLRRYCPSETVLLKLLPVVKASTKATLSGCGLSQSVCAPLASVLSSSGLTHLDLSNNDLRDAGVELLCEGLKSAPCRLHTLSLSRCGLSYHSCAPLASVLSSSGLTHLDLSNNDLWNSGVEQLSEGLKSAPCRLETLRLSGCLVSERGGASLASALSSASSRVRELDLSYNHPGSSAERLTAVQENPHLPLHLLRLDPAGQRWMVPGLRKYACAVSLDPHSAHRRLRLSNNGRRVTCDHFDSLLHHGLSVDAAPRVRSASALTGRCYWELDWEVDSESDWSGAVEISLSYGRLKGETSRGHSWSLRCSRGNYSVHHNSRDAFLSACPRCSGRVGVFLDSEAGALSFYEVASDGQLCHLHTFSGAFTEPLFPGFGLGAGSSVSLVDTGLFLGHDFNPAAAPPVPQRVPQSVPQSVPQRVPQSVPQRVPHQPPPPSVPPCAGDGQASGSLTARGRWRKVIAVTMFAQPPGMKPQKDHAPH